MKPERMKLGDNGDARRRKEKWWLWGRYTPALFRSIVGLDRVLAISQTSKTLAFAFLPPDCVYSHKVVVFPYATCEAFSVLQSRPHEIWARFFGSTMKDDAVYTPSDCFETFPFPDAWEDDTTLRSAGRAYYEFRANLMARNNAGLTTTYNRFHDAHEIDPEIRRLRELHAAMDRTILDMYGWTDIPTDCVFTGECGVNQAAATNPERHCRYSWPEHVYVEVLARLLELNTNKLARPRSMTKRRSYQGPESAGHPPANGRGNPSRRADVNSPEVSRTDG